MAPQLLTILCPVYNEEPVIPLFYERIHPVLVKLSERYSVDLVFLNNASTDGTLAEIEKVRKAWPATYVLTMSRNVGYHASLACGLRSATGDILVVIDVDCEDPPEMILQFAEKYEQGYDIVYGERVDREEAVFFKSARKLFYRLLYVVADEEIILDMAEFSLFTKEVRDAIADENTSFPFLRASIGRVGFRRAALPFKRRMRIAGNTHYNLMGMLMFAIGGILSASTLFLRLPIFLLPFCLIALTGLGIAYIETHSLWFLFAGFLMFAAYVGGTLAFTALYVARTYKNGLHRPNAFINHSRSILQRPLNGREGDTTGPDRRAHSRVLAD